MRLLRLAYLALGLGLLALVALEVDLGEMLAWLRRLDALALAVILALHLLAFAVDAVSWLLTVEHVPVRPRWIGRFFLVRLVGEAFNQVIPVAGVGGEPVKAQLLKERYGIGYHDGTASLVLSRTVNLLGLIGFLCAGFALMMGHPAIDGATRAVAGVGLLVLALGTGLFLQVQRLGLSSRAGGWVARRAALRRVAGAMAHVEEVERRFVAFYRRDHGRFGAALALAVANWLLGALEVYAAMAFLGHPVGWDEALIIEATAQMVRTATFFIPASLGAQDGAFVVMLTMVTGDPALGAALAAVRRGRELLWIALGFGVAACVHRAPRPREET